MWQGEDESIQKRKLTSVRQRYDENLKVFLKTELQHTRKCSLFCELLATRFLCSLAHVTKYKKWRRVFSFGKCHLSLQSLCTCFLIPRKRFQQNPYFEIKLWVLDFIFGIPFTTIFRKLFLLKFCFQLHSRKFQ